MKLTLQLFDTLNRIGDRLDLEYSKQTNHKTVFVDYFPSKNDAAWANQLFYFKEQFCNLTIQELQEKLYEVNMLLLDDFIDSNIKPTVTVITKDKSLFERLNAIKTYSDIELYQKV